MPLEHSKSNAARERNIKREIEAGKPPKQAVAIGYSEQREAQHKSGHFYEHQKHHQPEHEHAGKIMARHKR